MKSPMGLAVLLLVVVASVFGNENPSQVAAAAVDDTSKVKIVDNSRVLTKEEVDQLADKSAIPVVEPLLQKPERLIEPKIGTVVKDEDASEKLPPMPLIMPPFLHNVFEEPASDDTASNKPNGIVSVLLLKSHRIDDQAPSDSGVKSSSFVIMRYFPKSFGNLFGFDSSDKIVGGDDDVDKKRPHLFGGDDDVDKKRVHLLGGDDDVDHKRAHLFGGEGDPDRVQINVDESNKGVFTGGNDEVFANSMDQNRVVVVSMFDRLRSMFDSMRQSFEQQLQPQPIVDPVESGDVSNLESVPFISIRTDDGQSALIPNDIGYAEKQQEQNKCMMLQFMRLKASMYYRTILHLLFFTGVLLFIFSLVMLIVRACRRRQLARRHRRHHHHHHHHPHPHPHMTIAGGESKLAAYKAWQSMEQSVIEPADKIVLIQAPPAYDQVLIHDKNSTLTSRQTFGCQTSDECETKSLPPEYEEKTSRLQ